MRYMTATRITAPGTYTVDLSTVTADWVSVALLEGMKAEHSDCSDAVVDPATGIWTVTLAEWGAQGKRDDLRILADGGATVERVA
jgi:hypothetical protein